MKRKFSIFLSILLVLVLDQTSKYWASYTLADGLPMKLGSYLQLQLAFNYGVAFSIFHFQGLATPWILIGLTSALSLVLMYLIYQAYQQEKNYEMLALSIILGGALGNLIDRLRYGAVLDFIDAHIGIHHWPVFNIADSFICLGAFILIILPWVLGSESKSA